MKKYLKSILFCFIGFISFGQEELKLPNLTPASPEASAITKYGDVEINEFTGMVSQTIPLYTYNAGNIQLPISINYTGAGVKVDELPSWTGIKWTLNAGGVITRTLKDKPDEMVGNNRVIIPDSEINNYATLVNGSSITESAYGLVSATNDKDTEVDIFNFNFSNFSGSFYLDENFNGVLIKESTPLKIEPTQPFHITKEIVITTPDGIKYYFGGDTATEETELRYINGGNLDKVMSQGTTSFYLKQILHPIYGTVYLEYESINSISNIQLTKEQTKNSPLVPEYGSSLYIYTNCCTNAPAISTMTSTTTVTNRVYYQKYLSRIYSTSNPLEIIFISSSVDNPNFKRVLNRIEVKKNQNIIKSIDFDYLGLNSEGSQYQGHSNNSNRFFLTKIEFDKEVAQTINGQNNRKNEVYEFKYNSPTSLPSRFSNMQDYLGYFNGESNNVNLLPNNPVFTTNPNAGLANREPNFSFASKGVLTDVYYPTGGYTHYEYESPKAKKRIYETINLSGYRNQQNRIPQSDLNDGVPKIGEGIDLDDDGVIDESAVIFGSPIIENELVTINVTLNGELSNTFPTFLPAEERVTIKITDLQTNNFTQRLVSLRTPPAPFNSGVITRKESFTYQFVAGKTYKVEMFIEPAEGNQTSVPLEAYVNFKYFKEYQEIDASGVRVKKVSDFSAENSNPINIKRYYYTDIHNIHPELAELPNLARYYKITNHVINFYCMGNGNASDCGVGGVPGEQFVTYKTLHSGSFDNYFSLTDKSIYENVTISLGGDNFEKGGIEKKFYYIDGTYSLQSNTIIAAGQVDYDEYVTSDGISFENPLNGQLINEKVYLNKNNTLFKVSESNYTYDFRALKSINNIFGNLQYSLLSFPSGANVSNCLSNYYVGIYKIKSYGLDIITKQTNEFIEPIPLGTLDESIYKKMVSTQDYEYGLYRGLPTKVSVSTSENSVKNITQNYYVNQVGSLSGFTSNQIDAVNTLENKFIISKPIQVEQYRGSQKLATIRTLYKNISANSNFPIIVPDIIQNNKGDESSNLLENRVRFLEYDFSGRPTLVALENGAQTKYFYNSIGQVIMKIENYQSTSSGSNSGGMFTGEEIEGNNNLCGYHSLFPQSLVSIYVYSSITNQIIMMVDPNCKETNYEYDTLNKLKYIKDHYGNILQEFDSNFKRY